MASPHLFETVIPILRVRALSASLDYYLDVLGFEIDWHEPGVMASVSRDGRAIMLCEGDQGCPGTWVWIGVRDAAVLFAEYEAKGAHVRRGLTNFRWAYEMHVEDPDGHVLRFGSEPRTEEPFATWD
jgi:catechol 2,3-dioxygenase-like lactoylglutathione lyase family enzyme